MQIHPIERHKPTHFKSSWKLILDSNDSRWRSKTTTTRWKGRGKRKRKRTANQETSTRRRKEEEARTRERSLTALYEVKNGEEDELPRTTTTTTTQGAHPREDVELDDDNDAGYDEYIDDYRRETMKRERKTLKNQERRRRMKRTHADDPARMRAEGSEYFLATVLRWDAKTMREGERGSRDCAGEKWFHLGEAPVRYKSMDDFFRVQIDVAFVEANAIIREGLKEASSSTKEKCAVKSIDKCKDFCRVCLKPHAIVAVLVAMVVPSVTKKTIGELAGAPFYSNR